MSSFGNSSPTKSESDTESSWGDSDDPEQQRSGSPDVVFLGKTGDDNGSDEEETLSPLDISNSDTEEVRMAAVCTERHARVMSCMPPGETCRFTRVTTR